MQLKFITAAIASLAVGQAIAGPIPQPLDAEEALALYARAEQDAQAQQAEQANQHQQGAQNAQVNQAQQNTQTNQAEQAPQEGMVKQNGQWVWPGGISAGGYVDGRGYGSAYFNGLGISAYARGPVYYNQGYSRGYYGGRRSWNRYYGNRLYANGYGYGGW